MKNAKRMDRRKAVEPAVPRAFVQWKGTNVCADLYCECGKQGHLDVDFMYVVKCAHCGRIYDVADYVTLVPVPIDEVDEYDRMNAKTFGDEW